MVAWDMHIFYESVARAGLAGIAALGGQGVLVNGDDLYVRGPGTVVGGTCLTAAIANYLQWRFHRSLDPNWVHSRHAVRDQTGVPKPDTWLQLNYPIKTGDVLNAQADNATNAQIECALLAVAYGGDPMLSMGQPRIPIPAGAHWINGVGAATAGAGVLTPAPIVWSETFDHSKTYKILGMSAEGATMYVARLVFQGSSKAVGWYPGVPGGDTMILTPVMYGDFGEFKGDQPPDIQIVCSAGDTAQYVNLLVV